MPLEPVQLLGALIHRLAQPRFSGNSMKKGDKNINNVEKHLQDNLKRMLSTCIAHVTIDALVTLVVSSIFNLLKPPESIFPRLVAFLKRQKRNIVVVM